jgi:hypothetical protein
MQKLILPIILMIVGAFSIISPKNIDFMYKFVKGKERWEFRKVRTDTLNATRIKGIMFFVFGAIYFLLQLLMILNPPY